VEETEVNLATLASHTIDLDLLPEVPTVLDVGCRWFDFAVEVCDQRPLAKVIALDPSPDVAAVIDTTKAPTAVKFRRDAMVGSGYARQFLAHFSTGEGDFLADKPRLMPGWDIQPTWHMVDCLTISELMLEEGVKHFDVVKLDCEGSEFDILERWPGPIATQISVEFHDWDKPQYRSETYYDQLFQKLPWYRPVKHELSKQGTGVGHWDTLLVLR
jgi:FkbM family methyltransferase